MLSYQNNELPTQYTTELIEYLCKHEFLKEDPVVLVDVGCSGGLHPMWRVFGSDSLIAYGIDPISHEVDRLNEIEEYPRVNYYHYYVGLPEDHSLKAESARYAGNAGITDIGETSGMQAVESVAQKTNVPRNIKIGSMENPEANQITLDDFLGEQGISSVDYLKSDTDGFDIEVLHSAKELLAKGELLGLCVETAMSGIGGKLHNGFTNVNALIQEYDYTFFGFSSPANYTFSELPDLFEYNVFARTLRGMTLCANAIYMPDLVHRNLPISDSRLLKVLCIYVLQGYHDWAAKIIKRKESQLSSMGFDVSILLDMITPKLFGKKINYENYITIFKEKPELFLPKNKRQLEQRLDFLCSSKG